MGQAYPMAVVASKDTVSVGGVTQRVRRYPWGMVEGVFRRGLAPGVAVAHDGGLVFSHQRRSLGL